MARPSPVDWGGLVVTEKQLAGAAGGQEGVGGPQLDHRPVRVEGGDAPAPAVFDDEIEGEPALPRCGWPWRGPRRPGSARPRRRWRPRRRGPPGRSSGRLRGPAPTRPGRCGRTTAPRAASSRTRAGPSLTSTSTAAASHRPAPARQRVGGVQGDGVDRRRSSRPRRAARRPRCDGARRPPRPGPTGWPSRTGPPSTARRCAVLAPLRRRLRRGRQAGHAAADDEEVEVGTDRAACRPSPALGRRALVAGVGGQGDADGGRGRRRSRPGSTGRRARSPGHSSASSAASYSA